MWVIASAGIGLAEDEAYYWTWSKSLQWGYYDHAPMVAWWIRAGTTLFGDTTFGVRLLGPLATLLTVAALWRTVALLAGRKEANISALIYCATPMVAGNAVIITPDSPAMFFWALSLWAVAERLAYGNRNWWLAVGLFAGGGILSKYSVLFLGAGLFLCILTSRDLRRDLFCWQLWLGGSIAALLFVPVVWWNATHEWVSFAKQFGRVGDARGYDPRFFLEFLGSIFLLFHPVAVVLGGLCVARAIKASNFAISRCVHLAVSTSVPFLLFLVWHSQFSRVQGNWPAPLCFAFVLALVPALNMPGLEKLSRSIVPTGIALTLIVFTYAFSPVGFVTGEADKTNQMRGWDEFGQKVREVVDRENLSWIATSSYATTALLRWAFRNEDDAVPVIQITERVRYAFDPPPAPELTLKPALYVERSRLDAAFLTERFGVLMPLAPLYRGLNENAGDYTVIRLSEPKALPLSR